MITCLDRSRSRDALWYSSRRTLISIERDGKLRMISGQFVVVHVGVHQLRCRKKEKKKRKRKDSANSDDTASMIKGGGYLGARRCRNTR
jgi:hypothetical protein